MFTSCCLQEDNSLTWREQMLLEFRAERKVRVWNAMHSMYNWCGRFVG